MSSKARRDHLVSRFSSAFTKWRGRSHLLEPVINQVMLKNVVLILSIVFVLFVNAHAAVPGRSIPDAQIVAQAELVASGAYVEIYQHGTAIDPAFLKVMESAYEEVQRVTGLKLDTATLGPKVRVYVSDAVSISHVWKGYQHPTDPKAVIFLNLRVYQGAMSGKNATHVHELTHLFTWRYNSHTLREGVADYVALKVFPGAAVGPNPAGDSARLAIPPEVVELSRHDQTASGMGFNGSAPARSLLPCQLPIRQVSHRKERHRNFLETLYVRESRERHKTPLRFR